jgi:hypothetical protein
MTWSLPTVAGLQDGLTANDSFDARIRSSDFCFMTAFDSP